MVGCCDSEAKEKVVLKQLLCVCLVHLVCHANAKGQESQVAADRYAHYRTAGLQVSEGLVTRWDAMGDSKPADGRSLNRVIGMPRAFRVKCNEEVRTVLRLDGQSALWQAAGNWGTLDKEATVVLLARLPQKNLRDGFLFDGSTNAGMSRLQLRGEHWQAGVQPPPIGNAANADQQTQQAQALQWQVHAVSFRKEAEQTKISHTIFIQGKPSTTNVAAKAVSSLGGFILGANAAASMGLECDVAEVLVFSQALSAEELNKIAADLTARWPSPVDLPPEEQPRLVSTLDDPAVFRKILRKPGDDDSRAYRIPGLATSAAGTLLAVFDIRYEGAKDLPANIDVGLMRSTNQGETWSAMHKVLDFDQTVPNSRGNGVGDPAILVDHQTKTIFVAALWSQGDRAWFGSRPGLTPDETGQFVLTKSTDDGLTWSPPINITKSIQGRDPSWRLLFNGPGSGIQMKNGTLVFAAQFRDGGGIPYSCFLYSRDHGETWTLSPAAILGKPPTSEAQIAELDDGSLLLTMRDESRSGKRAWAQWTWDAKGRTGKWSEPWHTVADPTCMASLLRLPNGELIFSNPNSSRERVNLTLRVSQDGGKNWSEGRSLDPRGCMYSSLTRLNDGRIGILYEVAGTLTFARFSRDWITDKP